MPRPELTDERSNDYAIPAPLAGVLKGVVSMPTGGRHQALQQLADQLGQDGFINLFAQFIGLANQVAANAREHAQLMLVEEGVHPYTAEKINMPSLVGALQGVQLADGIDTSSLCHGCAFRLGSVANSCSPTTADADWCSQPNERPFMCHVDLDGNGEPTQACRGFAQRRRASIAQERVNATD
ncbi:hypothetical protein VPH13_14220 [Stenotrophomonas pavanii]|uniref:hypothetical protein n=1 Tax=Stenotrophomonas pavanii TaxID=487698 RepID=UPI002DBB8F12|nr:hypothetical protein [Stenotrophomonas pavanii]MEC4339878.1 hypothetical protein [Stenotrophomonas pavanii]